MADEFEAMFGEEASVAFTKSAADVPTIYADFAGYVYSQGGNYRFTLVENVADAPESGYGTWKSRPVVNIVMPAAGVENLLTYIGKFVVDTKAKAEADGNK